LQPDGIFRARLLPDSIKKSDPLFTTRWVHVFEEDTPEGAVYRPDSADLPLSRRLREQLEDKPKGEATKALNGLQMIAQSGPDDVWITFYQSKLWWTRVVSAPVEQDGISKFRRTAQPW